jgi:hypothetical protein
MEHISTVAHLYFKGKQPEIERGAYPRTAWHVVALIYAFSTCSVDGMDQQLMHHCTMMHVSMTFLFQRGDTIVETEFPNGLLGSRKPGLPESRKSRLD